MPHINLSHLHWTDMVLLSLSRCVQVQSLTRSSFKRWLFRFSQKTRGNQIVRTTSSHWTLSLFATCQSAAALCCDDTAAKGGSLGFLSAALITSFPGNTGLFPLLCSHHVSSSVYLSDTDNRQGDWQQQMSSSLNLTVCATQRKDWLTDGKC